MVIVASSVTRTSVAGAARSPAIWAALSDPGLHGDQPVHPRGKMTPPRHETRRQANLGPQRIPGSPRANSPIWPATGGHQNGAVTRAGMGDLRGDGVSTGSQAGP